VANEWLSRKARRANLEPRGASVLLKGLDKSRAFQQLGLEFSGNPETEEEPPLAR
jgi:hypothetical protein